MMQRLVDITAIVALFFACGSVAINIVVIRYLGICAVLWRGLRNRLAWSHVRRAAEKEKTATLHEWTTDKPFQYRPFLWGAPAYELTPDAPPDVQPTCKWPRCSCWWDECQGLNWTYDPSANKFTPGTRRRPF